MVKLDTTKQRHDELYKKIYDLQKKYFHEGVQNYVQQALKTVSEETGFTVCTLRDLYYRK